MPANSSLACLRVWSMVDNRRAGQAVGATVDDEQADALRRAGGNDDERGQVTVDDVALGARQGVGVAGRGRLHLDARLVPAAVLLGEGHGCDGLTRGDAGQVLALGGVVARQQQRVGGQRHGGEERGAQQAAAHLLEDHAQLDVAVARASVLLGDGQALQAQLLGHLAPDRGVVALVGLHQPPYLGLAALVGEKVGGDLAQLFLLFGEGEVQCVPHEVTASGGAGRADVLTETVWPAVGRLSGRHAYV